MSTRRGDKRDFASFSPSGDGFWINPEEGCDFSWLQEFVFFFYHMSYFLKHWYYYTGCLPSYVEGWLSTRGLDVSLGCARVTVVSEQSDDEKYHWIVVFRRYGKVYPYMYRTVETMAETVRVHHEKYGVYPYRMWVIVNDEIQKVVIN